MAIGTARSGFAITKPKPAQNLNYQTQTRTKFKLPNPPATRRGFNFFKKIHPQRVLTITKPAMVSGGFFAGFRI